MSFTNDPLKPGSAFKEETNKLNLSPSNWHELTLWIGGASAQEHPELYNYMSYGDSSNDFRWQAG